MFLTKRFLLYFIAIATGPLAITCLPDGWRLWPEGRADHVIEERSLQCDIYVEVINLLGALGGPATAFCSSYLHIPSVTTVEPTVVPQPVTYTYTDILFTTNGPEKMIKMLKERRNEPANNIEARATPAALQRFTSGGDLRGM
ncbi:uncharacterized protein N7483_006566 [Penicillium malachiteum]|uniref:uncharacterized protein n=1 Tax=Penicillium malachiteum TaxID=1324776 RepID=UPI0025488C02|nr:uncharacterized protein N7483_006566 [Penicillium malachiteum]KAJ5725209.1 hypothetical protein N7483_006566 [Penicillium malachiteum]